MSTFMTLALNKRVSNSVPEVKSYEDCITRLSNKGMIVLSSQLFNLLIWKSKSNVSVLNQEIKLLKISIRENDNLSSQQKLQLNQQIRSEFLALY